MAFANKKGQFFSISMALLFCFIIVFMFVKFDEKEAKLAFKVGDKPIGRVKAYKEVEEQLWYLDQSLMMSAKKSISELGQTGGYVDSPCGSYEGYTLWNNKEMECYPDPKHALKDMIKDNFGVYVDTPDNYEIMVGQDITIEGIDDSLQEDGIEYIKGKDIEQEMSITSGKLVIEDVEYDIDFGNLDIYAVAGTLIKQDIECGISVCGKYEQKPSAAFHIDYPIQDYYLAIRTVKSIMLDCSVPECADKMLTDQGYKFEMMGSYYTVEIEQDTGPALIKFAFEFIDKIPPPPVEGVKADDLFFAEKYVLLRWEKSDADDVKEYRLYKNEKEIQDAKGLEYIEASISEVVKLDVLEIYFDDFKEEDNIRLYAFCSNGGKEYVPLDLEKLYETDDEYIYLLPVEVDDKELNFAVTCVDLSDNENTQIKSSSSAASKDDMPPGDAEVEFVTPYRLSLSVDTNADGTIATDVAGFTIYDMQGNVIAGVDNYFDASLYLVTGNHDIGIAAFDDARNEGSIKSVKISVP